ncbi:MAG: DUF6879 family protein [Pseudonocardiales bacterium]
MQADLNLPDHEGVVVVPPSRLLEIREVLTLDQLGEFVAKHHGRDLFRLETLPFYNAASDDDDFRRYLQGDPDPTAKVKRPWLDRIRAEVIHQDSAAPFVAIAELLWNQATDHVLPRRSLTRSSRVVAGDPHRSRRIRRRRAPW